MRRPPLIVFVTALLAALALAAPALQGAATVTSNVPRPATYGYHLPVENARHRSLPNGSRPTIRHNGAAVVAGSSPWPGRLLVAAEEGSGLSELAGACHSFAPATLVVLADGTRKAISEVAVGDRVRTTDPATGKTVVPTVTALHRNHDTDLADLVVSDGRGHRSTVHTTQHHRFWDDTTGGWVDAADLRTGDRLHTDDGKAVSVKTVRSFAGLAWMYDLTVDDVHTYYVVAGAPVLVHNCPIEGETPIERIYEGNSKHGASSYLDSQRRGVSRAPMGDCQAILDCSVQRSPNSPNRIGIEPETGLQVELRRHLVQDFGDRIVEYFHGYVPGG